MLQGFSVTNLCRHSGMFLTGIYAVKKDYLISMTDGYRLEANRYDEIENRLNDILSSGEFS
ncbi:MAG: hypothetical protein DRQ44_09170 [Gammaproteobacteria bacterium]|nr:MAG: hypothetical protein DRQ44_09170 [Gammaproteobacteria bacterium]